MISLSYVFNQSFFQDQYLYYTIALKNLYYDYDNNVNSEIGNA